MRIYFFFFAFSFVFVSGYSQFAPPVGQAGTTAIHKDSSVFVAWATTCTVTRGYMDISDPGLGFASAGDSTMALGIAGSNGVVSLGDRGTAILTFASPIQNGSGWDFAVFENAFSNTFLELATVEVSSDGINYYMFSPTSNTQDTVQVSGFGSVDATKINNLAGKYIALYGTPFDLQELAGQGSLDVNNITHIKITDAVGCIQDAYATYDMNGRKINDPWNTPFASSGFDLDAVGVIHEVPLSSTDFSELLPVINVYPNPVSSSAVIQFFFEESSVVKIYLYDISGRSVMKLVDEYQYSGNHSVDLDCTGINDGIYFIHATTGNVTLIEKIMISSEK